MAFQFNNSTKSIPEILEGSKNEIQSNNGLLAKDYLEKTGRKGCRTCPSDLNYMILTLKNLYKMTQFKFKRHAAQYKNKKGDRTTLSNSNMTDEKAIEFLNTNPERIRLFSDYPSNWETLILDGLDSETEAEKEKRLAAEAEVAAAMDLNDEVPAEETEAEKEMKQAEKDAEEALKPKKEDLLKMSLKDLRAKYPNIKATSIKDFVQKVIT
jgi:hypothetical protein